MVDDYITEQSLPSMRGSASQGTPPSQGSRSQASSAAGAEAVRKKRRALRQGDAAQESLGGEDGNAWHILRNDFNQRRAEWARRSGKRRILPLVAPKSSQPWRRRFLSAGKLSLASKAMLLLIACGLVDVFLLFPTIH